MRFGNPKCHAFIVGVALCVVLAAMGCGPHDEFAVKYLGFGNIGGPHPEGPFAIRKYLSGSDHAELIIEEFPSEITSGYCEDDSYDSKAGQPSLIMDRIAAEIQQIHNICLAMAPFNSRIGHQAKTCHPWRGLFGVCGTVRGNPPGPDAAYILQFLYVYEQSSGRAIFVDSAYYGKDVRNESQPLPRGYFDRSGGHFYYCKRDVVYQFNIDNGARKVISNGDGVIVPWNSDDVIITSTHSRTVQLLGSDGRPRAIISEGMERYSLSAFKVDELTFVIAVYREGLEDSYSDLYVLDFGRRKVTLLYRNSGAQQIISAERVGSPSI